MPIDAPDTASHPLTGTSPAEARDGRHQPIRRRPDDFDLGLEPTSGTRHSDESIALAKRITFIFGGDNTAVHDYEQLLGYAPIGDLRSLRKRGAIIVMVPMIPEWLCCEEAAVRRGRSLTEEEQDRAKREFGPGTGTAAIYDPETDSLVLPTRDVSSDPLHPIMHELGHALTLERVWKDFQFLRPLLEDLPERIQAHLALGYPKGDDDSAVRSRIAEVFAEAYAMFFSGRDSELPQSLTSALVGILADMDQHGFSLDGSIDPASGRTATFVRPETMIREGDTAARPDSTPPRLIRGDRRLLARRARRWPPSTS